MLVTVKLHHRYNPNLSDDENRDTYGLCNNPTGHGHNYDLEVTVEGEVDPGTGYVMDLKKLKHLLEREVLADVDHNLAEHVAPQKDENGCDDRHPARKAANLQQFEHQRGVRQPVEFDLDQCGGFRQQPQRIVF